MMDKQEKRRLFFDKLRQENDKRQQNKARREHRAFRPVVLHAKLGTWSASYYRCKWIRKIPHIGQTFFVKESDRKGKVPSGSKWERVRLWKLHEADETHDAFYFLERA